ncbi:MAG: ATP synthase subunit C, partial [Rhabdochlamydiaceae bacterium]
MDYAMIGPAIVLGLGCIGSSIGCGIGGMASHAVMSRVEENHGKFIGMSA